MCLSRYISSTREVVTLYLSQQLHLSREFGLDETCVERGRIGALRQGGLCEH